MLKKTRVSPTPDFSRIAAAISRPGIDPRVWESLAIVRAVNVDASEGVFVDIMLMPSQLEATARLGAEYAGNGFGLYFPVSVGDEVVVSSPSGDPAEGFVIQKRVWSPSDPPPSQVAANPTDAILVVAPGANLRIFVSNGGTVKINGDSDAMALASKVKSDLDSIQIKFDAHVHPISGVKAGPDTVISSPTATPVGPLPGVASSIVQAGG